MGFPPYTDHFVNAVHDKEYAKVLEQKMQATSVAMGTLDESQVSGILARAMAQVKSNGGDGNNKRKQSTQDILQQALLDYIRDMNQDIAKLERNFEAEFGDAWREEIALRVFDEDEIPRQRPDESVKDYRTRLEKELVDKMLNPDGSIKDKYKDDPNLRKYAQWAQKIHNRDVAQQLATELKNPDTTHEQAQHLIHKLEEARNSELNLSAADQLDGHDAKQEAVLSVDNVTHEEKGQIGQSASSGAFLSISPPQ